MAQIPKKRTADTSGWWSMLVKCAGEIGVSGTAILVALFTFVVVISGEQKREFWDSYILLKTPNPHYFYLGYIGILVVTAFFIRERIFRTTNKADKKRIAELEEDVRSLQAMLSKRIVKPQTP